MRNHYNQYELVDFLKNRKKYMSAKEIANETNGTITTINRKLNKRIGRDIEIQVRKRKVGHANHKIPIKFYRYKR